MNTNYSLVPLVDASPSIAKRTRGNDSSSSSVSELAISSFSVLAISSFSVLANLDINTTKIAVSFLNRQSRVFFAVSSKNNRNLTEAVCKEEQDGLKNRTQNFIEKIITNLSSFFYKEGMGKILNQYIFKDLRNIVPQYEICAKISDSEHIKMHEAKLEQKIIKVLLTTDLAKLELAQLTLAMPEIPSYFSHFFKHLKEEQTRQTDKMFPIIVSGNTVTIMDPRGRLRVSYEGFGGQFDTLF